MAVRSLVQRFERLAAAASAHPPPASAPSDRAVAGARSVAQLADVFEPGAAAAIRARQQCHSAVSDGTAARDARMRVLLGSRLLRLRRRRRRRLAAGSRSRAAQDPHGRQRPRHRVRHGGDKWCFRPHVALSAPPSRLPILLFELQPPPRAASSS